MFSLGVSKHNRTGVDLSVLCWSGSWKSFWNLALEGKLGKSRVLVDEVKRTTATLPGRTQPAHFLATKGTLILGNLPIHSYNFFLFYDGFLFLFMQLENLDFP